MMTVTRDDQHDPGIEAEQRVLPDVGEEEHQQDGETSEQQQRRQEVLSLEARRSELEIKLIAARSAVSSAVERKEFMEEEVEQARDYDKKLAQEMTRLARIAQNLPPEQSALLEKLRRLVVTLTEVERQETALHEDARAREEALRSEIEDFIGVPVTAVDAPVEEFTAEETGASTALLRPTSDGIGASAGGRVFEDPPVDDPLAVIPTSGEAGGGPADAEEPGSGGGLRNAGGSSLQRMLVTSAPATIKRLKKQPKKEGRALLAQGLDRIEAAHKSAAAEREAAASSLSLLRLAVAKRQRLEDAAPGHAELLQYLLRFEELGHHAAERQNQLRKCRAERSTLALTREFLANQARLMESIASGVGDASKGGKAAREAYLRQLEGIAQGVEDHLANQTRLLNSATIRRKAAEEAKETLKDDRTRFLAYTRELAEECYRYDALSAHLALMRR